MRLLQKNCKAKITSICWKCQQGVERDPEIQNQPSVWSSCLFIFKYLTSPHLFVSPRIQTTLPTLSLCLLLHFLDFSPPHPHIQSSHLPISFFPLLTFSDLVWYAVHLFYHRLKVQVFIPRIWFLFVDCQLPLGKKISIFLPIFLKDMSRFVWSEEKRVSPWLPFWFWSVSPQLPSLFL